MHQTYVDVGVMARHLQEKYREYSRRKIQPFRVLVDQGTHAELIETRNCFERFALLLQLIERYYTATDWTAIRLRKTKRIQMWN